MSPKDVTERLQALENKYGAMAPTRGDVMCRPQLRKLHEEVVKNQLIPSDRALEPNKILPMGGDNGVSASQMDKDKELVGEDAVDGTEFRSRVACYVHSIGLVTVGEEGGERTYVGALRMLAALRDANNLTSLSAVSRAVESALCLARRQCNRRSSGLTLGDGYELAAAELDRHNGDALALRQAAAPTAARAAALPAADGALPAAAIAKAVADALKAVVKPGSPGANGDNRKKPVKLENGKTGWYKSMPGGNAACPVACKKPHGKDAVCEFHHKDK